MATVCLVPGCPNLRPCHHARTSSRNHHGVSRQARGYGAAHQHERTRWAAAVRSGTVRCARCGLPIRLGERWDLGHAPDGATWTGPEHAACNRADGARRSRGRGVEIPAGDAPSQDRMAATFLVDRVQNFRGGIS